MDVEIRDLNVTVDSKTVLDKFNLSIKKGEIHVIMGPNGAGKSTLSKVIMGSPLYKVKKGDILCNGKSIKGLTTDERARLGIFLSFQNPTDIEGVTNSEFLKMAINSRRESPIGLYDFIKELSSNYDDLNLSHDMMHRGINGNFSGGEKKKNEIIQMKTLKPSFIILDELDSGLDVDSLKIVCKNVNKYIKESNASVLIITHYNKILDYLKPDYVHVLIDGAIKDNGDYTLAKEIEKNGYNKYLSSNKISEESSHE